MKDTFSNMHPFSNLFFFVFVTLLTVVLFNPVCLFLSLSSSLAFALYLNGGKAVRLCLFCLLPMLVLIILINPAVNHEGATIITYLPWGNPLTLESILYGAATGALLCAAALWFSCLNTIMTTDKFIYLFGRIIPSLSLVISMALRFVPKLISDFRLVFDAQKAIGNGVAGGSVCRRVKNAVKILSIVVTRALEGSIETADSMRCRGYGLRGRTSYSAYSFKKRDELYIALNFAAVIVLLIIISSEKVSFTYFPYIKGNLFSFESVLFYTIYLLFANCPLIISVSEGIRWKYLKSKI